MNEFQNMALSSLQNFLSVATADKGNAATPREQVDLSLGFIAGLRSGLVIMGMPVEHATEFCNPLLELVQETIKGD